MPEDDLRTIAAVLERDVELAEETGRPVDEPREALEALDRVRERLDSADEVYQGLGSRYALVWPVQGVLLSRRRRKRLLDRYRRSKEVTEGHE